MCNDNIFQGIWVGSESSPTLLRNLCEGNKDCGIAYFDKAGGVAKNNVCRNNGYDKIYVASTANPNIED